MVQAFTERFRRLLSESGMTQQEAADVLGLSRSAIAGYATGRRMPDVETLLKISCRFDVSIDWLVGNDDVRGQADRLVYLRNYLAHLPADVREFLVREERGAYVVLAKELADEGLMPEAIREIAAVVRRYAMDIHGHDREPQDQDHEEDHSPRTPDERDRCGSDVEGRGAEE